MGGFVARKRFSDVGIAPGAVATAAVSRPLQRRRAQAGVALDYAARALERFDRGVHLFGLTKGQFSMIDLAAALLDRTGPADVAIWTWCIAEYEVQAVTAVIGEGRIRRFRMVMDWAGAQRDMPLVADLQQRFGADCIRVTKTHAKVVQTSTDDGWRITARGSMNLNANPRFEQFNVCDDPDVFGVVDAVMAEMWERAPALPVRAMSHSDALDAAALQAATPWVPPANPWWTP